MSKEILLERALNMRLNPTQSERIFKERLELKQIRHKSQWVIGNYIVDFLINKTIIEIDGSSHNGREIYDEIRDSDIRSMGYKIIRIKNSDVNTFDLTKFKKASKNTKKSLVRNEKFKPLELLQDEYKKEWLDRLPEKQRVKIKPKYKIRFL